MLARTAVQLSRLSCLQLPAPAALFAASALQASSGSRSHFAALLNADRSNQHTAQPKQLPLPFSLHACHFSTSRASHDEAQLASAFDPAAIDTILQANRAAEAASLIAAKADAYLPTQFFINLLDFVHCETLWPWWAAIAATNIFVRTASLPLAIFTQKQGAKMQVVNQAMAKVKELQAKAARAEDYTEYQRLQARINQEHLDIMAKHGSTLKKSVLLPLGAILNAGIFISLFSAINRLSTEKVPSFTHGGAWWFTDLTVPDPYFGIPLFCCAVTLASVELGAMATDMNMAGNPEMMRRMMWFMRIIALAFIPAGNYVPSAVGILWVSNSIFGIVQSIAFRSPAVRQRLGLPLMQVGVTSVTAGVGGSNGGSAAATASAGGLGSLLGGGDKAAPAAAQELKPPPPRPKLYTQRSQIKRRK